MAGSLPTPRQGDLVGPVGAHLRVDPTRAEVLNAYSAKNRVEFYWFPEEFGTSVQPNWEEQPILGRSEPFFIYANTGPRTMSLDFTFFAQGLQTGIENAIDAEVLSNVRFIESLAYPVLRDDGVVTEPASCWLTIGKLYAQRVIMTGAPAVTYKGPWEPDSILPYQAAVSCEFTEVHTRPRHAADMLSGKSGPPMARRY